MLRAIFAALGRLLTGLLGFGLWLPGAVARGLLGVQPPDPIQAVEEHEAVVEKSDESIFWEQQMASWQDARERLAAEEEYDRVRQAILARGQRVVIERPVVPDVEVAVPTPQP